MILTDITSIYLHASEEPQTSRFVYSTALTFFNTYYDSILEVD